MGGFTRDFNDSFPLLIAYYSWLNYSTEQKNIVAHVAQAKTTLLWKTALLFLTYVQNRPVWASPVSRMGDRISSFRALDGG